MEGRRLRERKGVSYDEKKLEAQRYDDAFDFMDTDTEESKQGKTGRRWTLQCWNPFIGMHETLIGCTSQFIFPRWLVELRLYLASAVSDFQDDVVQPRSKVVDEEEEEEESNPDSDFKEQDAPQQSLDEASEEAATDDSDFAAEKERKKPTRKLAARGGAAARTGMYKEPSSGDEIDAESSSGAPSLHLHAHASSSTLCQS